LAPKYRFKIFYIKRVKKDCESIFKDICAEKGYKIHAMEVVKGLEVESVAKVKIILQLGDLTFDIK